MLKQYVVDAFTDKVFSGNPAAICVLDSWLPDELMQKIAIENNLSETAFTVREAGGWHLRWFTPGGEIDLCGHATLATAFVLTSFYEKDADTLTFTTLSGTLTIKKDGNLFRMDFPAYELKEIPVTDEMETALGARPVEAYLGRDLLCVMEDEQTVRGMTPGMEKVKALPGLLQNVTAKGSGKNDCVSRSFGPKLAVPEDPVCGSGHCHIIPYWAKKLGKKEITAYQASRRGGTLYCRFKGNRCELAGRAALYAETILHVGE